MQYVPLNDTTDLPAGWRAGDKDLSLSRARPRAVRPFAALAGGLLALIVLSGTAAPAHAWKCCDQWGYDYPGTFWTQNGCQNAGGIVYTSTAVCPNFTFPFKCCDASGAPIQGVYGSPHDCKVAGHEVFSGLTCPNSGPFQCCDPDGGSAPGVYLFRWGCVEDGYVVQDFTFDGCPGGYGLFDDLRDWWNDNRLSYRCPKRLKADYTEDTDPDTTGNQSTFSDWAADHNAAIPAGTEICGNDQDDDGDSQTDEPPCQWRWSDKDTHCTLSCLITVECGERSAQAAGWFKETQDMCDDVLGNGWGSGDECANQFGRNHGVTLSYTTAAAAEEACRNYCTGLTNPALEETCGPSQFGQQFLTAALTGAEAAMPDTILGFDNPLSGVWTNFITNCGDGLFPLTYPNPLADTVAALTVQGQELIAAALTANINIGQSATFPSGTLIHRLDTDHYTVFNHVPTADVDAYLEYVGGALRTLNLRGASGHVMTMTMADPVQTACSNPSCEKRIGWMRWAIEREPVPALIPSTP